MGLDPNLAAAIYYGSFIAWGSVAVAYAPIWKRSLEDWKPCKKYKKYRETGLSKKASFLEVFNETIFSRVLLSIGIFIGALGHVILPIYWAELNTQWLSGPTTYWLLVYTSLFIISAWLHIGAAYFKVSNWPWIISLGLTISAILARFYI